MSGFILLNSRMMEKANKSVAGLLRQKAEEDVKRKSLNPEVKYLSDDIQLIIHELQVHQIELEMQNEELIRAREESEIAHRKYKELYDFAPSGYFRLSQEDEIVELNLCASQMVGKERLNLKKSRLGFFISERTKHIYNDFLVQVVNSDRQQSCEVEFVSSGNVPIVVQLSGIASDNRENCLVTAVDITQRKVTEIELRESRELYEDLVASQVAGIYRVHVQNPKAGKSIMELTSLEFASNRFCELFEVNNSGDLYDILARSIGKINPDCLQGFIHSQEVALNTLEPYKYEMQILVESGMKWIRLEANPHLLADGCTRWTGLVIDITKQKLAEEAMRRSEEKYRMLLELASDAFFQGSEKGDFIIVNTAAKELTGYSKDELLKMNMKDLFSAVTLQENPPKYEQLRKGETVYSERDLVRKDGTIINIEMNSRMMPDQTYQAFIRNITERKRIEKALKQKLGEMEIYYELAITRERKMIALKSEINILLGRLGEMPKY